MSLLDWFRVPDVTIRELDQRRYEQRLCVVVDGKRVDERAREPYSPFVRFSAIGAAEVVPDADHWRPAMLKLAQ